MNTLLLDTKQLALLRLKLPSSSLRGHVKQGTKVRNLAISLFKVTHSLSRAAYSKDAQTNPRGIPYAPFVDKVEDYVSSRAEVDGTMKSFQEMISYAFVTSADVERC